MSRPSTPVLTLENGYHHFIDTCICGQTGACRLVIDGAIVRLVRLGTPLLSERKTILTDAVITVNRGELRYLNESYVLDEFTGALTVLFNHGTYRHFLADYSIHKVFPQGGRWMVDSADGDGCGLIVGTAPGEFFVSGDMVAYAVSADGTRVAYSVGGVLHLPQGLSHVQYAPQFSTSLLPAPPEGLCWVDNGFGEVVAATAVREVFVSEHGRADGDGSAARPLASVGAAAALLGDANGIVHIVGTVPYSAPPPHRGIITYRGEGKSTRLVFDRPYYYYLSGDSVFDNLYLVMYSEGTALVSAGHSLRYGPSVWTTVNMFSVLSQPSPESETALAFGDPLMLSSEQSTTISAPHNYVLLYCFSDHALLQVGKSSHTLSAGGAVFLHDPDNVSVRCGKHARIFVCTFRSFPSSLQNVRIKPVRAAAATLFGNILEQVWADPSLFQTDAIRKALSDAVHTVMGIDDSRMKIHHQLNLFLESHFAEISSVEEVARQFHMNRSYLEREFKKTYGFGIKQDLTRRKLEAARKLLSKGFSVAQAAKSVGYDNAATFSRAFRNFMGLPPSAYYRKQ